MSLAAVSGSDNYSPLQLTKLFLWELKTFYATFTRFGDLNCLSQRKHTLCLCIFYNGPSLRKKNNQMDFPSRVSSNTFSPINVLLNLCALTMIDDTCRTQCRVKMTVGAIVLIQNGASVT